MLRALNNITNTYSHILKQGCMAHGLDFMLEDRTKIQEFNNLIEQSKRLCQYIKKHHTTMLVFCKLSPTCNL